MTELDALREALAALEEEARWHLEPDGVELASRVDLFGRTGIETWPEATVPEVFREVTDRLRWREDQAVLQLAQL